MAKELCLRRGSPRRSRLLSTLVALPAALIFRAEAAFSCDLCAIYTATELQEAKTGFRLGVAEQYTRFGTLQQGGEEVSNPDNEFLDSSITQFVLGYHFLPRVGVQLNVPVIARDFRRVKADGIHKGDVDGFGDLSILAQVLAYSAVRENTVFRLSLFGGLKLPSGDPSLLEEEQEEGAVADEHSTGMDGPYGNPIFGPQSVGFLPQHSQNADVQSGIHGHDLALGSGSVDGILGMSFFWSWRKVFFSGSLQYLLRTEGSFNYQYANDLLWSAGPGVFAFLGHDLWRRDYSLAWQTLLTGETKGQDEVNGHKTNDTAITALYIGPGFTFTWGTSLSADIVADLPVLQNNTSLQIVPDYRLRGGITWRF
jgi:hypothetical protein